jgi:hypothetical protein
VAKQADKMKAEGAAIEAEVMNALEEAQDSLSTAYSYADQWTTLWASRYFAERKIRGANISEAQENYTKLTKLRSRISQMLAANEKATEFLSENWKM